VIKKTFLLIIFIAFNQIIFAQQKLPVLKSDSLIVNIKINDQSVGAWQINADTKPGKDAEVFTIERSFDAQKVSYISNNDSISFNVNPDEKYDFIILVNNKSFLTEVATAPEPVFQHKNIIIIVGSLLIIIALITFIKIKSLQTKLLLYFGIISPLLFWVITIIGGFIHGNYNHLHNDVSELGAIGTKSEMFMSATETLVAVCSIFSIIGFYKACKQFGINAFPVLTILALSISMFWAAIFPMHHVMHATLGPIPFILYAGVLLSIFIWRKKSLFPVRIISLISFVLMILLLLRIIPDLRNNYEGMLQRFFYLGWTLWSVSSSIIFLQLLERKIMLNEKPINKIVERFL